MWEVRWYHTSDSPSPEVTRVHRVLRSNCNAFLAQSEGLVHLAAARLAIALGLDSSQVSWAVVPQTEEYGRFRVVRYLNNE